MSDTTSFWPKRTTRNQLLLDVSRRLMEKHGIKLSAFVRISDRHAQAAHHLNHLTAPRSRPRQAELLQLRLEMTHDIEFRTRQRRFFRRRVCPFQRDDDIGHPANVRRMSGVFELRTQLIPGLADVRCRSGD